MLYKIHFKTILKVLLLLVITFVLVEFLIFHCKPNSSIIEGNTAQESNNKTVQHQIQNRLLNIPDPPNSLIKATHGICLDASQRSRNGGKVHMWNCNPNNKNQQWNYNSDTKQIKATHGLCLDASQRNNRGGKVHMWNCNPNNKNQQWDYNSSTKQIKATHGKCLDASQRSHRGGKVHMWDCNPNNKNQQWELNSQQSQVTSTNPPNTLQVSGCAVPYSGKLQLSETLGIFNIFGEDKIVQCNNQTPELVSAKKTELPSEINLTNQSGNNPHIKYNDTVKLCNKIYHIKNKDNSNSNEKIKYGDVAKFVPSAETIAGSENNLSVSEIKATHGICLDASQRNKRGGKVHMWNCNKNNKNQQWSYNPTTKQIKATHGLCLDASQRNNRGGKVHMWNCDPNNKNQQWDYNSSTKQIKATHGKCLDASQRSRRGGKVHMWDCNPNNKNQQWEITPHQQNNLTNTSFLVTFNPNVYGESNVKNLKYSDFSELYGTQYEHCSDSNNVASISAK